MLQNAGPLTLDGRDRFLGFENVSRSDLRQDATPASRQAC